MKFKKFMFEDYLSTSHGARCLEFFGSFEKLFGSRNTDPDKRFYKYIDSLLTSEGYSRNAYERAPVEFEVDSESYSSISEFVDDLTIDSFEWKDDARKMQQCVPYLSAELFLKYPEFAFPYLLPRHYYKLDVVCQEIGVNLPEMPKCNDHQARFNYYFKLCKAIYDFRIAARLSPVEMCVLIYGYGMRFVEPAMKERQLRAGNIFLLYGSREDFGLTEEWNGDEVTVWQGKEEMMPGDIILLYTRNPISSITSIWRTVSPGFMDPFGYYDAGVFIGQQIKIPHVAFRDLAANDVWRSNPLIAAHMQNGSGRACTPDEYQAILSMAKAKDPSFDIESAPKKPTTVSLCSVALENERDVEKELVEPFLKNMGYSDEDWARQYSVRVNREHTSIPDYVVSLDESEGIPHAKIVLDAKFSIPTKRQLKQDFGQVLAYGHLLQARYISLVAKEGVWVWSRQNGDFIYEDVLFNDWEDLLNPAIIANMRKLFHS